jgi:hypothetical protein
MGSYIDRFVSSRESLPAKINWAARTMGARGCRIPTNPIMVSGSLYLKGAPDCFRPRGCVAYAERLCLSKTTRWRRKCRRNRRWRGFASCGWANAASASSSQRVTTTATSVPKINPASVIVGGGGHRSGSVTRLSVCIASAFGKKDTNPIRWACERVVQYGKRLMDSRAPKELQTNVESSSPELLFRHERVD